MILWFPCFKKTGSNNHQVCRLQTNLWKISQLLKSPGFTIPALLLIMSFHFLPYCDSSICAAVWWAWAVLLRWPVGERICLSMGPWWGPTSAQVQVCQQRQILSHKTAVLALLGVTGCHMMWLNKTFLLTMGFNLISDGYFHARDKLLEVLDRKPKLWLQVMGQS